MRAGAAWALVATLALLGGGARAGDEAGRPRLIAQTGHPISSVAFSPDGRTFVTGSSDKTARVRAAATGKEVRRFEAHIEPIRSVAFSPNEKSVLTASTDGDSRRWDAVPRGAIVKR